MRRLATRQRLVLALAVLFALALLAPTPAAAVELPELPDLTPDIPGPADLVREMFEFFFKTFFGIEAKVTRRAVELLVAHPVYTDAARYPELHDCAPTCRGRLGAVDACVHGLRAALLRVRVHRLRVLRGGQGARPRRRGGRRAGVYPQVFGSLCVAGNLLTYGLLDAPGVEAGLTKLLAAAPVANFTPLGIGTIAAVVAVVILLLLMVTKIVLATLLALLFVAGAAGDRAVAAAGDVVAGADVAAVADRRAAVAGGVGAVLRAVRGDGRVGVHARGLVRRRAGQAVGVGRGAVRGVQGAAAAGAPGDARRADAVARAAPPRAALVYGRAAVRAGGAAGGAEGVSGRFGAARRPASGRGGVAACATRPTSTSRRKLRLGAVLARPVGADHCWPACAAAVFGGLPVAAADAA